MITIFYGSNNISPENNRLNLSKVARELFDPKECYCTVCGEKYIAKRPNASLYCKECAVDKEKARIAKKNANRVNDRN